MSCFECSNGHIMLPSQGTICRICGAKVARMDGYTNSEWKRIEEYEDDTTESDDE